MTQSFGTRFLMDMFGFVEAKFPVNYDLFIVFNFEYSHYQFRLKNMIQGRILGALAGEDPILGVVAAAVGGA